MLQLVNGLMHIRQCGVFLLLFKGVVDLGSPALGQFFKGADIDVAVVQIRLQLGHVPDQKAPVLANGVAAQG